MADMETSPDERLVLLIEAAVQRYVTRLTRRYVPLLVGAALISLVAVVLPTKEQRTTSSSLAVGTGAGGLTTGSGLGEPGSASPGPAPTPTGLPAAGGGAGGLGGGGTADAGAGGLGASSVGVPAGVTVASGPSVARSGVHCGPGVLQVTWTPYAAPCVAAFTGANGGATAPGVTNKTITVVMRSTPDGEAAQTSTGGPSVDQEAADAQVLINFFSKNFETYGRQVVLKVLHGQGSSLQELQGGGQAGAEADAQSEKDMGAFADVTSLQTATYGKALAERGIIMMGAPYTPEAVFRQYSPYMHGTPEWPTGESWGHGAAATVCQRMQGMPAVFAVNPIYAKATRVFGLTNPQQPDFAAGGSVFLQDVQSHCGLRNVKREDYSVDLSTEPQQAVTIVAQLKAAGVTTVVHAGDPFMLAFLTLAAQQQNYHPEWLSTEPWDDNARMGDQGEMGSVMKVSPFGPTPGYGPRSEAGRVFRLASGGVAPQSGSISGDYVALYMVLLELYDALQAAGPHLSPGAFLSGLASLPPAAGEFGLWRPNLLYNPVADYVIGRWEPNATNPNDGQAGAFKSCDGGARYSFADPHMGSGQLGC